jgi:hypothetical protein
VGVAKSFLDSEQQWLKDYCRTNVSKNASAVTAADECIMARVNLRYNILNSMK